MVQFFYKEESAPKPTLPPSIGCIAFIQNNGKYLLEHRSDSSRWAFIGGAVEKNESFEECLFREVLEETNLKVRKYKLETIFSDPSRIIRYDDGNSKRIITIAYSVEIEDFKTLQISHESQELRFVDIIGLLNIKMAETHIPCLQYLLDLHTGIAAEN